MRMRRVVVLLPPATVKSSDAMAARYGSSRSEVLRHAIAEGLPGVRKPLERLRKARLEGLRAVGDRDAVDVARRRGGRPAGSVAVPGLEGVDVADRASAVKRLGEYGRSVRGSGPAPACRRRSGCASRVCGGSRRVGGRRRRCGRRRDGGGLPGRRHRPGAESQRAARVAGCGRSGQPGVEVGSPCPRRRTRAVARRAWPAAWALDADHAVSSEPVGWRRRRG